MPIKKSNRGRATSVPVGLAWGVICAFALTILCIAVAAELINKDILPWNTIGYLIVCILILSSCIGARVSAKKIKRRKLAACMITGGLYFAILLITTGLFFGGNYSGVGETALLIICGSLLAAFTGNGRKKARSIPK